MPRIDFKKLDNWQKALKGLEKVVGKDLMKTLGKDKVFDSVTDLIKDSDKYSSQAFQAIKGNRDLAKAAGVAYAGAATIPQPVIAKLRGNNEKLKDEQQKLRRTLENDYFTDLLDRRNRDRKKYSRAMKDLVGEISLYTFVYGDYAKMQDSSEDAIYRAITLQWSGTLGKDNNLLEKALKSTESLIKSTQRMVAKFKKINTQTLEEQLTTSSGLTKDQEDALKEQMKSLYATYNERFHSNSGGVRSVTTALRPFLTAASGMVRFDDVCVLDRFLAENTPISSYDDLEAYAKKAAIIIKKLTFWANPGNAISSSEIDSTVRDAIQAGPDGITFVATDLGLKLARLEKKIKKVRVIFADFLK